MTSYTVEVDGSTREFLELSIKWDSEGKNIHTYSVTLKDPSESVSAGDSVVIKRDGTSIFTGIVESIEPSMGPMFSHKKISGRHVGVKLWRKWTDRCADQRGYWTAYYPNKIVEFLLHPSTSDRPVESHSRRRVGWGLDPTNWTVSASENDSLAKNAIKRLPTAYSWSSANDQTNGQYFQIDLGSSKNICGIRIENHRTGTPEQYIRNYKIETSTTGAWTGEEVLVASKTNNRAINIVESWDAASTRYIRITCTAAFADHWSIGEIYVYEARGTISGISAGTLTEHLPLNSSLMASDAASGQPDIVVKESWRFSTGDYVVVGDDNGEETNTIDGRRVCKIASISGDTLTLTTNLGANYTVAANGFVTNISRFTEINHEYMRRSDAIDKIVKLCTTDNVPWEWEVTDAGAVNMGPRIGSDKSGSVGFVYQNDIDTIIQSSSKTDNRQKVDAVLVLGAGTGDEQDRNSSGWVGSGDYESVIVDKTLETAEACRLRAEAILEEYSSPEEVLVTVDDTYSTGTWGVGDTITLTDSVTGLSGSYKVKTIKRTYKADGETVVVGCTLKKKYVEDVISSIINQIRGERGATYSDVGPNYITDQTGFSLFYEAEHMILDPDATIEDDSNASNEKIVKMASAQSGVIWWGPAVTLTRGDYRVLFLCKVTDNSSSSNLVTLDVYSATKGSAFASRTMKPNEFNASDTWEVIAFSFTLDATYSDVEFRANNFASGITDFYCDWIGIVPHGIVDDPPGPPSAPTNVSASSELSAVRVIWDANTEKDLNYYIVYRGTSSPASSEYARTYTNYLLDGNVNYGTTYYYRIKAVDWSGNVSDYSATEGSAAPSRAEAADLKIELRPWQSNLSVVWDDVNDDPPTDFNHIKWGAPGAENATNADIKFADGTTDQINYGENTDVADGTWYIYWDKSQKTGGNYDLQWSQTYTDAVGSGKGLFGIVDINSASSEAPTIILFGSYTPTIGAGVIGAYAILSKHITASEWIEAKKFRTASSGQRVEFDTNGIYGYNNSDEAQFYLLASSGKAKAGGGNVILDANGITIRGAYLLIQDSNAVLQGYVKDLASSGYSGVALAATSGKDTIIYAPAGNTSLVYGGADVVLNADTDDIILIAGDDIVLDATGWTIFYGSGMIPIGATQDIGSSATPFQRVYADTFYPTDIYMANNGDIYAGTSSYKLMTFKQASGTTRDTPAVKFFPTLSDWALLPASSDYGYIGESDRYWYMTHSNYVFSTYVKPLKGTGTGYLGTSTVKWGYFYADNKNAAFRHPLHNPEKHIIFTCVEGPKVTVEDWGVSSLTKGVTFVEFSEEFCSLMEDLDYAVVLQEEDDCNGLYVSRKEFNGFEVKEKMGGTSNVKFSWIVKAVRMGDADKDILEDPLPEFESKEEEEAWFEEQKLRNQRKNEKRKARMKEKMEKFRKAHKGAV